VTGTSKRPVRRGVPSYAALYPALRRKQPPRKFSPSPERQFRKAAEQGLAEAQSMSHYIDKTLP
jgi:hypothetical protein